MAILLEKLSSVLITGHYLEPDDRENGLLIDYELGGIALNNTDEGLRYQVWTLRYINDDVVISAPEFAEQVLFTRSGITRLSFTFDQNMNPFVAFVENDQAKFWWYDSELPGVTFSNLPAGSLTPVCCLDDKRETQTQSSSIILSYVHAGALKYRHQDDRYVSEKILQDPFLHPKFGLPAIIRRVGMSEKNRLQWTCDLANPIDWCGYVNDGN